MMRDQLDGADEGGSLRVVGEEERSPLEVPIESGHRAWLQERVDKRKSSH